MLISSNLNVTKKKKSRELSLQGLSEIHNITSRKPRSVWK
jgi:hypothetical protein